MRRLFANVMLAGLGFALPLWAFAQTPSTPVITAPPAVQASDAHANDSPTAPVWARHGSKLSVIANGNSGATVPGGFASALDGSARSADTQVWLGAGQGLNAHAGVRAIRWAPLVPVCGRFVPAASTGSACPAFPVDGMQHSEVGAGFAGRDVKFGLSVGQSHSQTQGSRALTPRAPLPRVLPTQAGADVAAPLWFRNSTATDISAHGQLNVAPGTRLNLGASVGHVRFLPDASGQTTDQALDQTTLSLGIQHGAVRGTIVGHILEPDLPGAALDRKQRWSGIDLGISVRLPWRGELDFGARNVWTSGRVPFLFGPVGTAPLQGRVPYVQYHQIL